MDRNEKIPAWCGELKEKLARAAEELTASLRPWACGGPVITPEETGYTGQGSATAYIQAAIDRVHGLGGGTVLLAKGEYISGTIVLRSRVRLRIGAGAALLGSTDLADYPEHRAKRLTVQDTSMGMHQSLIFAEGCEDIALCGPGTIGSGAIGSGAIGSGTIDGRGVPANFPGDETCQGTPGRPFVLRVIDCRRVYVAGLTLKNSPCWMQNYLNCEDLLLENLTVRNHANYNNDGIDIDGCRRVIVRGCDVRSGDDALCFKGASQRTLHSVLVENCRLFSACNAFKVGTDTQGDFRDVWVRNCRIGGLDADPSGLKHPYCDSGVSLEMVDGGTLENFLFTDIDITRAWSPFFMRLEDRGRVKPGDPAPGVGTLRRALFERVTGRDCGPRGSYFIGVPEKYIEDIVLRDVDIRQRASRRPPLDPAAIGEMRGVYPDAHMIDDLGDAPAYALWTRRARGVTLDNYRVVPEEGETRPEYVME